MAENFITVVSGLPRSGTSLMMQMLVAGGLPALTDAVRSPDESNPRGYFEFEPVKRLRTDASWLEQARGRAVKIIHLLLRELPTDGRFQYRVLFLRRPLEEVIASQSAMLARAGKASAEPVALGEGLPQPDFAGRAMAGGACLLCRVPDRVPSNPARADAGRRRGQCVPGRWL